MGDQTSTSQIGPVAPGGMPTTSARSPGARVARTGTLLVAALLALHGLAHAAGVAGILGLGDRAAENTSTLLSGLDPASPAFRTLGVLWIVALGLFVVAAAGIVLKKSWWLATAFAATLLSLALCVVWSHAAIVGLVLNAVILVGLADYALMHRRTAR